jgi:hypothetical protein
MTKHQPLRNRATNRNSVHDPDQDEQPARLMAPSTGDAIYRHLAPPLTQPTELARLSADLPGYDVIITRRGCSRRFEAIRRPGGPEAGPWCVISTDPADLWRELAPWTRPGADIHALAARAP